MLDYDKEKWHVWMSYLIYYYPKVCYDDVNNMLNKYGLLNYTTRMVNEIVVFEMRVECDKIVIESIQEMAQGMAYNDS